MILQDLIELGDIVILDNGRRYVYLRCFDSSSNPDGTILVRRGGFYFGKGLSRFDDSLRHIETGVKIVKVYRPNNPLTQLSDRYRIDLYNFDNALNNAIQVYPNKHFINISLYV